MNKKYRMLLSNSLVFAIGSLGSKILLFFLVPIATNALSKEEYATADLVITIGDILLPVISLTIYDALLPFGLRKGVKKENVFLSVNIIYILGLIGLLAITPLFELYSPIAQWKWYLFAYIVSSFTSTNTMLYLKVKEKNKSYVLLAIIQAFILTGVNVWLLCYLKMGIKGYLVSMIVSRLVTALLACCFGTVVKDLRKARYDKVLLKEMVRYSVPLIANAVSWWVINSSDKLMLESMLGESDLGLYTAATKLPSFLNLFTSIFSQAWMISSIREYGSDDQKTFYSKVFKYYSVFIIGIGMGINMFIKLIMSVYVGKEFIEAWTTVPMLMLSAMLAAFSSFLGSMYGAFRKSKNVMVTTLCGGIVNIVLNFCLIPRLGGLGAAIATMISYLFIVILRMIDVNRETKINYSLKVFIPVFILALVQGIAITCDFMRIQISLIAIACVLFMIRKDIKMLMGIAKKMVSSRRK